MEIKVSKINLKVFLIKERLLRHVAGCVGVTLIISTLSTYQLVVLQRIIDDFDLNLMDIANRQLWFYFPLSIFVFLMNIALTVFKINAIYAFKHKFRVLLLKNLNIKDEIFFQRFPRGKINDVLTKDVDEIIYFFSTTFLPLLSDMMMALTVITILLLQHFSMGVVFTIYFVISFFILYRTQSKNSDIIETTRKQEMKYANDIEEVLFAKNEIILMNKKGNIFKWLEEKYDALWPYKKSRQKFIYQSWMTSLCLVSISN